LLRSVNTEMVVAYWNIGRETVQLAQAGDGKSARPAAQGVKPMRRFG